VAKPLFKLSDEQEKAASPQDDIWLTASAGTGKTQVLTARVMRLLLSGAPPESILCLTFTKAAAAEMAERLHKKLAQWVRASDNDIKHDLFALGAPHFNQEILARARTLFARVLSAKGSGLSILTLHSFCESLLAAFPVEAGISPHFTVMSEADEHSLFAEVLHQAVVQDDIFKQNLSASAFNIGEQKTRNLLAHSAQHEASFEALGEGFYPKLRLALGMSLEPSRAALEARCHNEEIEKIVRNMIGALTRQKNKTNENQAGRAQHWLSKTENRLEGLEEFMLLWLTQKDTPRSITNKFLAAEPAYESWVAQLDSYFRPIRDQLYCERYFDIHTPALLVARKFAQLYGEAKRAHGYLNFDDLIYYAKALLKSEDIGAWIRYKMDKAIDHILVDEAQDTNDAQWAIINALSDSFYDEENKVGAHSTRSMFAVGDEKQAIFSFQGTNPQAMQKAQHHYARKNAAIGRTLSPLQMNESWRSTPMILNFVDKVLAEIGFENLGLVFAPQLHETQTERFGHVELMPLIKQDEDEEAAGGDDDAEGGSEDSVSSAELKLATAIAKKIKAMIVEKQPIYDLAARKSRPMEQGDVMIVLRQRGQLARLIIARLHEENLAVAGIDRLPLRTPLVINDAIAALKFALQPFDDLNLACLLVSPLIGWSQEELQAAIINRPLTKYGKPKHIWQHLRDTQQDNAAVTLLYTLLRMADTLDPGAFFETLLSGKLQGRAKALERLGEEARDSLNALVSAAQDYSQRESGGLQGFLGWYEKNETIVKRESSTARGTIRVLTVHGAKGLQAPVVILADASRKPREVQPDILEIDMGEGVKLPITHPNKEFRLGELGARAAAQEAKDVQEYYRLLYVALTRAETRLLIWGFQKTKQLDDACWYRVCERAFMALGAPEESAAPRVLQSGILETLEERKEARGQGRLAIPPPDETQAWVRIYAPQEKRPARPLQPSRLMEDSAGSAPLNPAQQAAVRRGKILHMLLEKMPGLNAAHRKEAAQHWLRVSFGLVDAAEAGRYIDAVTKVLENADFAHIFSNAALVEAPLAGVVNGVVISGTVDRVLITENDIFIVDYKTTRRPPRDAQHISIAHQRQMAAYVAVLKNIFPQHEVQPALLYTEIPALMPLSHEQIAAHWPSQMLEDRLEGNGD
jgi:ATP-dependent helicase/nuclease subunit A